MADEEQIILPERFKRVEYLQSTGTQYINTNYIPNAETGFYVDAQNITGGDQTPMGSGPRNANSMDVLRVPITTANSVGGHWGAWYSWTNNTTLAGNRFIGKTNFLNDLTISYYINEELNASKTLSAYTGNPTVPIYIFGTSNANNNGVAYAWKGKIFEAKISQGTEIIKHFVPAYDTYTARYCMYELKEGKAYYVKGTGDFAYDLAEDEQLGILHKLPEGFTKVNYLIANGSQYIDTNYVPTNETGYYLEGQGYTTSDSYFFGSTETTTWSDNNRIYFSATPNLNWGWMTYATLTSSAAYLRQETKVYHNFLNDRISKATVNDTEFTYNLPQLNFTPTKNVYLFGVNFADTKNYNGLKGRIDTFLISEGDQIVRQFVPCLDEDGSPCMYELYTGTVHYNQGSGQFSYPREYTNDPINLPANYTKCVYLQSDGTQWIDTDVIPNADTGVYIKTQQLSYGDHPPMGSWESSSYYYYVPRINTSSKAGVYSFGTTYQLSFYYDKGDDLIYTSTMNLYNDRTLNFWSEDTNWFGIIPVNFTATFTRPLWLFSYNMDNTSINATYGKFGGRIFRAKITQGDYLIHDFVPCLDTNNRPCMYDLVTQTPYYNQSGGTEFTYCIEHELPSDFIKLDYLESTGTQYIKTGYVPTNTTGLYVDAYNNWTTTTTWTQPISLRETNGNTYVSVGRVVRESSGAGFGWGAYTSPGGTGNVRYEASLNFLNDRQSIISAPAFAQRVNALSDLPFTPTFDLCMFGMHNYDGTYGSAGYRIYRAKISEGSEIVRDYVPAYDEQKLKPCMYDLINNVAYYNDGTGEFVMPPKREGSYTGFAQLGSIFNRIGGGEIVRGVLPELPETPEGGEDTGEYLLMEAAKYTDEESYLPMIDLNINFEDFAAARVIFQLDIDDNYVEVSYGGEPIPILTNYYGNADEYGGIHAYCWGEIRCATNVEPCFSTRFSNINFENKNNVYVNFNSRIAECNGERRDLEESYDIWMFAGEGGDAYLHGWYSTAIKIYECSLYDTDGNEISHMIPHEENGQRGLYCTVRNIFLPIQTI